MPSLILNDSALEPHALVNLFTSSKVQMDHCMAASSSPASLPTNKRSLPPSPPLPPCLAPDSPPPCTLTPAFCAAHTLATDSDFWMAFHEVRPLGRGCFGTVLLVRARAADCVTSDAAPSFAAKVVVPDDATDALREASLLRAISHPNIVTLVDVYASASTVFVVMGAELGGDLQKRAEESPGGVLSEAAVRTPMAAVLAALRHLHVRHGIVHRDVKASNVLLAADGVTAKLADFGLAARLPTRGRLTTVCGTHDFLAPEMILTGHGESDGYGTSVDCWAVGLMLHGLLWGKNPFERDTDIATLQAILAGDYAVPDDGGRASPAVCELLAALLIVDPVHRATADHAVSHRWLREPTSRSTSRRRLFDRLWPSAV